MNRREALAALTSLPIIAASKIEVRSKDVIVIEIDKDIVLSAEEHDEIKAKAEKIWPDNPIVCLQHCTVKVIRGGA